MVYKQLIKTAFLEMLLNPIQNACSKGGKSRRFVLGILLKKGDNTNRSYINRNWNDLEIIHHTLPAAVPGIGSWSGESIHASAGFLQNAESSLLTL